MDDWDDLRYFLAIVRAGSLAGAARTLGVNHSTMFRRLNALETRLGARLFERLPQAYVATAAGEEARRHAEDAEAAVHALERAVAGGEQRLSGEIRLTTAANLASDYVAPLVMRFHALHPDIRVDIAVSDSDLDLARREADLALRATSRPPETLIGRHVVTLPWYAVASPDYLAAHGRPASVDALRSHRLIGADAAFSRIAVFAWQRSELPERNVVARASDLNTMAALAQAGLGIAFLPGDQVRSGLERLFVLDERFQGSLWLLTHPDLRRSARLRAFSDFLYTQLRADPRLAPYVVAPGPRAAAPPGGARRAVRKK